MCVAWSVSDPDKDFGEESVVNPLSFCKRHFVNDAEQDFDFCLFVKIFLLLSNCFV